jgi:hypothetical protein
VTDKDIARIAAAFAETEALIESGPDPQGLGISSVRICQDRVAVAIAADRPRFKRASFDMDCFPAMHARLKASILATLGKGSSGD